MMSNMDEHKIFGHEIRPAGSGFQAVVRTLKDGHAEVHHSQAFDTREEAREAMSELEKMVKDKLAALKEPG